MAILAIIPQGEFRKLNISLPTYPYSSGQLRLVVITRRDRSSGPVPELLEVGSLPLLEPVSLRTTAACLSLHWMSRRPLPILAAAVRLAFRSSSNAIEPQEVTGWRRDVRLSPDAGASIGRQLDSPVCNSHVGPSVARGKNQI